MKRNDYQKLFNELLKLNKGAKKDFTLQQFEKAIWGTLPKSYLNKIYLKQITSKEAKKYLAGHLGYIKYANVNNLINSIFYVE